MTTSRACFALMLSHAPRPRGTNYKNIWFKDNYTEY
jgi:hypothetical protein